MVYRDLYHFIPFQRLAELCNDNYLKEQQEIQT
jgi:hypothetical protein